MAGSPLWYFAYGSMTNFISLQRRGLFPTASWPATLTGYRLAFELGGMANIVFDPHSSCQGVLHRVTQQEFAVLKEIESNYETVQVPVVPYSPHSTNSHAVGSCTGAMQHSTEPAAAAPAAAGQCELPGINNSSSSTCSTGPAAAAAASAECSVVPGHPITATAFIVQPASLAAMAAAHPEWGNSLPSDRYIRIITAGLQHYGVDPGWVKWVAEHQCKPSRQPHEYRKLPVAAPAQQGQEEAGRQQEERSGSALGLTTYSLQKLAQWEGKVEGGKARFGLGSKLVEVDMSCRPNAPMSSIMQKHFAGRQVAFHMCMMLHEPRLPPISTPADVQREHVEWAEDQVVEFMSGHGYSAQQIGWLEEGGGGVAGAEDEVAVVVEADEALHAELL